MPGAETPARPGLLETWRIYRRARRTIGCRDCAGIAKHPAAGTIVAGDPPYQVMHNGMKVGLGGYHGGWMAEVISQLGGHHEPQEERIFQEVLGALPAGACMIEAGSYWAYYSMWFRSRISDARVYMVEPVAFKLKRGMDNFRLNGLTGVFRHAFVGAASSPAAEFTDWDGTRSQLERVAIDDFLDEQGISFLDLLHADIQGGELDMLRGCRRALSGQRIGYLFISTHPGMHEPCLAHLRGSGYEVVFEHSIAESCSGDGLIVARGSRAPVIPPVSVTKKPAPGRVRENLAALAELATRPENRRLWSAIRGGE